MNANLEQIKQEIISGAEELASSKEVYEFKKKFLDGKNGKIGMLMKEMKNIPPEAVEALFTEFRRIKRKYKNWELVKIEGADGSIVDITL